MQIDNNKKINYSDRKIIWRLIDETADFQEFKSVVEFYSYLQKQVRDDRGKIYADLMTLVDEVMNYIETDTILNNLSKTMLKINESMNLGLDMDFVKKYQYYGLHRDQKILVAKLKVPNQ